MLIQGLGVSLFIFSLANHTAGVPTVITHPEFKHDGDGPVDTGSRKVHRRCNHFRRGVWSGNYGGDIHEGAAGPPGGTIVFARFATAAAVPCDTSGYEIEIERTATGSIKDVYASCGGGGYRVDSRPAGRNLL